MFTTLLQNILGFHPGHSGTLPVSPGMGSLATPTQIPPANGFENFLNARLLQSTGTSAHGQPNTGQMSVFFPPEFVEQLQNGALQGKPDSPNEIPNITIGFSSRGKVILQKYRVRIEPFSVQSLYGKNDFSGKAPAAPENRETPAAEPAPVFIIPPAGKASGNTPLLVQTPPEADKQTLPGIDGLPAQLTLLVKGENADTLQKVELNIDRRPEQAPRYFALLAGEPDVLPNAQATPEGNEPLAQNQAGNSLPANTPQTARAPLPGLATKPPGGTSGTPVSGTLGTEKAVEIFPSGINSAETSGRRTAATAPGQSTAPFVSGGPKPTIITGNPVVETPPFSGKPTPVKGMKNVRDSGQNLAAGKPAEKMPASEKVPAARIEPVNTAPAPAEGVRNPALPRQSIPPNRQDFIPNRTNPAGWINSRFSGEIDKFAGTQPLQNEAGTSANPHSEEGLLRRQQFTVDSPVTKAADVLGKPAETAAQTGAATIKPPALSGYAVPAEESTTPGKVNKTPPGENHFVAVKTIPQPQPGAATIKPPALSGYAVPAEESTAPGKVNKTPPGENHFVAVKTIPQPQPGEPIPSESGLPREPVFVPTDRPVPGQTKVQPPPRFGKSRPRTASRSEPVATTELIVSGQARMKAPREKSSPVITEISAPAQKRSTETVQLLQKVFHGNRGETGQHFLPQLPPVLRQMIRQMDSGTPVKSVTITPGKFGEEKTTETIREESKPHHTAPNVSGKVSPSKNSPAQSPVSEEHTFQVPVALKTNLTDSGENNQLTEIPRESKGSSTAQFAPASEKKSGAGVQETVKAESPAAEKSAPPDTHSSLQRNTVEISPALTASGKKMSQTVLGKNSATGRQGVPYQPMEFIHSLSAQLWTAVQNNRREIFIRLQPENLGLVRVRLKMEKDRLSGKIAVNSPEVHQLLVKNAQQLTQRLQELNIHFDSLNLDLFNPGSGNREQDGAQQATGNQSGRAFSERQEISEESEQKNYRRLMFNHSTFEYIA